MPSIFFFQVKSLLSQIFYFVHGLPLLSFTDMSSWEVYMAPGRQSVFLYLTSSVPATFSAQLCVPDGTGCTPMGQVHSLTVVSMCLFI